MKERMCICGSKVFMLTRTENLLVDYSKESAVLGSPRITNLGMDSQSLCCNNCRTKVPHVVSKEMFMEII